jgi:hypothetical protein
MSEETQATPEVNLEVVDLQNAAQVIDLAVQRGAFRGNEAAQVGAVYNKLTAFIEVITARQAAQAEQTAESDDADTATE